MRKYKTGGNQTYLNVFIGFVLVLIVLYGINIFITGGVIFPIKASAEESRPANLHLTLIVTDCDNCYDMNNVISFIKRQNVKIIQERSLSYNEEEAQALVSKNNIKSLPAVIITGQVSQSNVANLWNSLGVQPLDNTVIVSGYPPYYSLTENKIVGLVQVIRLTDNSCAECYDVERHMEILPSFGIFVEKSLTYDVSSSNGKNLVQKYNITKVPTTILSPDVSAYASLDSIWDRVGTVEGDGWYVFRATEQMGIYRDLSLNKTVNATG